MPVSVLLIPPVVVALVIVMLCLAVGAVLWTAL